MVVVAINSGGKITYKYKITKLFTLFTTQTLNISLSVEGNYLLNTN